MINKDSANLKQGTARSNNSTDNKPEKINEEKLAESNIHKTPTNYFNPNFFKKPSVLIIGFLLILVIAGICVCSPYLTLKTGQEALIKIPANADIKTVADTLTKYFGNEFSKKTTNLISLKGKDLTHRHGAYLVEKNTSPYHAARKLLNGAQEPLNITINGFRLKENMAKKIAARLDFSEDSLLRLMADNNYLKKYGLKKESSIALFLDDTYEVYWNFSPEQLLSKIGNNYQSIWNDNRKEKAKALGLTPEQVMILCSIVDEESNKADDKGKIGRLYVNRLHKGMKLQADPTVKFALGDFSIRRIRGEHLGVSSPYNTYKVTGLPPGPIRTTSIATIDSVLNSKPHDFIYMCAKDDFSGYHAFATTYQEHMDNARRYQRALNRRGIK